MLAFPQEVQGRQRRESLIEEKGKVPTVALGGICCPGRGWGLRVSSLERGFLCGPVGGTFDLFCSVSKK